MAKISGVILTKNSGESIESTLSSLSFCDEIIVIDENSKDTTLKIVRAHKARFFNTLSKNFSEKRNLALKKAKHDWILYVDSDEVVTEELRRNIQNVAESDKKYSAYKILRKNFYLGNNLWPHEEKLERLFKRDKLMGWTGELHESPKITGETGELEGYLLHYSHKDLFSMLEKTNEWSNVESLLRFKKNHPKMKTWRFFRIFATGFYDYYIKQEGWKVGAVGLIESIYQGFSLFITYAKLWELQQNEKSA